MKLGGQLWATGLGIGLHVTNAAESVLLRVALNRFEGKSSRSTGRGARPTLATSPRRWGSGASSLPVASSRTSRRSSPRWLLEGAYTYGQAPWDGAGDFSHLLRPGGVEEDALRDWVRDTVARERSEALTGGNQA